MVTGEFCAAASDADRSCSRQKAPPARSAPLQTLLSDNALVRDSLEPTVSQAWNTLPATWMNASPIGSRRPEDNNDEAAPEDSAANPAAPAAEQPPDLCKHRGQDPKQSIDEAHAIADKPLAGDHRGVTRLP